MSGLRIDPAVRRFLLESGLVLVEDTPTRMRLQDGPGPQEPNTLVVADEDGYTVTWTGDRRAQTVKLQTDAPQALDRYLLRDAGSSFRGRLRMKGLVISGRVLPHPGIDIEDAGPRVVVRWEANGRRWSASCSGTEDALMLARELLAPVEDLIASYRDPDGLPVYPQGRRDLAGWRRR